jgi:NAD(P)H-hydrate epimerase
MSRADRGELPRLRPRTVDGHKGTFGTVGIWAGSRDMPGAAILCAHGALRGGAGLVRVAVTLEIQQTVVLGCPPATTRVAVASGDGERSLVADCNALVIGPGLGGAPAIGDRIEALCGSAPCAVVVDADGLQRDVLLRVQSSGQRQPDWPPWVLTPHPGEAARLLQTSVADVQGDRAAAALELAQAFDALVCLKGAGTLVARAGRVHRNPTGNPGMATAGSGDVLAGLLGALLAREAADPSGKSPADAAFDAAVLATYVHGRAGDLAAAVRSQVALTALDLIEFLPAAWLELERG